MRTMCSCCILQWSMSWNGKVLSPVWMWFHDGPQYIRTRVSGVSDHFGDQIWKTDWYLALTIMFGIWYHPFRIYAIGKNALWCSSHKIWCWTAIAGFYFWFKLRLCFPHGYQCWTLESGIISFCIKLMHSFFQ